MIGLEGIQETNECIYYPGISLEISEIHEMLQKSLASDIANYALFFIIKVSLMYNFKLFQIYNKVVQ